MIPADELYGFLVTNVLDCGEEVETRNSKCLRLVGKTVTFDRTPLVSVRATAWRNAIREWEWFMSGSNNVKDLHPDVRKWWEPWADKTTGSVSFNYSCQFRLMSAAGGVPLERRPFDQIKYLVDGIKNHPYSRRNAITTWYTPEMASPDNPITNCHNSYTQAIVHPETNKLDLFTVQRSCDLILGVPHNWVQEWAFLMWLAKRTGREVGSLVWTGVDVHIYDEPSHLAAAAGIRDKCCDQLYGPGERPELKYDPPADWDGETFVADHFDLTGPYKPALRMPVRMIV